MQSKFSYKQLKRQVSEILSSDNWESRWDELIAINPQKLIAPLFSALYSSDPRIKWHAVSCFGRVTSELASDNMERARIVMRRCIWNLNDESGGIGWGSPEVMAETMTNNLQLANEYHKILCSFIQDKEGADNFLEYPPLRSGAYWGIARLSQVLPDFVQEISHVLTNSLKQEQNVYILGCTALSLNYIHSADNETDALLRDLVQRSDVITLYWNKSFWNTSLSEISSLALTKREQT